MKLTRILTVALLALLITSASAGAIGQRFLQRDADQHIGRIYSVAEGVIWQRGVDAVDHCFDISQRRQGRAHKIRIGDMYRVWVTSGDATAWDHKRGRTEPPPGPNPCLDRASDSAPRLATTPDQALQILIKNGLPIPPGERSLAINWEWVWGDALPFLRDAYECIAARDRRPQPREQTLTSMIAAPKSPDWFAFTLCRQAETLRAEICASPKSGCSHHPSIDVLINLCRTQAEIHSRTP